MLRLQDNSKGRVPNEFHSSFGLSDQDIVSFYKQMVLIRSLDDRILMLNRQGKIPIASSSQGHETAEMGSLLAAQIDGDFFIFPYYRCLALKVMAGLTPLEAMLSFIGKDKDPYSNGRQFPLQGADLRNNVIQLSNVVAAGITQAVGYAWGCRMQDKNTVVLSYFGDGASSQGECHEAMNFAAIHKLPVVFICENNSYAISVPLEHQMAIENVSQRAGGYGFPGYVVDGMDLFQVLKHTSSAISRARVDGPVLLEMKVHRFKPHTTDDDDTQYRSAEEVELALQRDPVKLLENYLIGIGIITAKEVEQIMSNVRHEIDMATDMAGSYPDPDPATLYDHLYAP